MDLNLNNYLEFAWTPDIVAIVEALMYNMLNKKCWQKDVHLQTFQIKTSLEKIQENFMPLLDAIDAPFEHLEVNVLH